MTPLVRAGRCSTWHVVELAGVEQRGDGALDVAVVDRAAGAMRPRGADDLRTP